MAKRPPKTLFYIKVLDKGDLRVYQKSGGIVQSHGALADRKASLDRAGARYQVFSATVNWEEVGSDKPRENQPTLFDDLEAIIPADDNGQVWP